MKNLPKVILIGRANVGKSTLFNRLTETTQRAIVSDIPGTTRDRKEATVEWRGKQFCLVDSGGLNINSEDPMEQQILKQALVGLKQSDFILMIVDTKHGLSPVDVELANWLKKSKKQVILIANKADSKTLRDMVHDFNQLGLGEPWPVSAANGTGTGDLMDFLIEKTGARPQKELPTIRVAIIGKPNVGKSSLINSLLNEDRTIVHDQPHTTRDSQDILLTYEGRSITLVDTAGIRRRSNRADVFEKISVAQSTENIRQADVVVLMTEVNKRLTFQDKHIADEVINSGASVIMVGNKWDLLEEKTAQTRWEITDYYQRFFPWLTWAPLLFMSARERNKTTQLLKLITEVYEERHRFIEDAALEKFLKDILKKHKPSRGKGTNHPYIYQLKQLETNPPRFILKINFKGDLHASYPRFIENQLRFKFGFIGTPMKMIIEKVKI